MSPERADSQEQRPSPHAGGTKLAHSICCGTGHLMRVASPSRPGPRARGGSRLLDEGTSVVPGLRLDTLGGGVCLGEEVRQ